MKRTSLAIAALTMILTAGIVHAADLKKYENWDQSPVGYFMTKAEQAQWNALRTDEEAETFVAGFLAKRDSKFTAEVTKRAEMADKYLTIGKVKGSATLRGKAVILFGAPAAMSVEDRKARGHYAPPPSSSAVTNLGVGASTRDTEGESTQMGSGQAGRAFRDFTFTFSAKNVPALGSDYSVTIEADAATGKDRVTDKKKAQELEEKFEAVAAAFVAK
jgi:GWxTD domain-containing protein